MQDDQRKKKEDDTIDEGLPASEPDEDTLTMEDEEDDMEALFEADEADEN